MPRLNSPAAVPLIILSASREPVEALNGILRRAGQPAHCTWIPALPDLADALAQINPELLLIVSEGLEDASLAARIRDQTAPEVPVIAVCDVTEGDAIAQAMRRGIRDVATLSSPNRLEAVMLRELRSFRLERALNNTLQSAREYRRQLETVLERSNDAIAHVQEGIVVDVNDSWLQSFGSVERGALVGQPLMDSFDTDSHAALKGALSACLQGKWDGHALVAKAVLPDGRRVSLDIVLAVSHADGEPSVRLIVPATRRDDDQLAEELADAVRRDPSTGLLHRRAVLEALRERLATPASGGVRYVAQVRIDKFASIERDVGIDGSEQVLIETATLLRSHLSPHDVAGRFGGVSFLILLDRGNERDIEAWADQLITHLKRNIFHIGAKTISATCSIGLSVIPHGNPDLNGSIDDAIEACRRARQRGGNQHFTLDRADADTRVQAYDQIWVKHIKSALFENRFKLVQQPVASLHGGDADMIDLVVRMVDLQGKEILPGEFLPAAERNDLLKNIDRWVIGASLSLAARRKPDCLFVRLSRDSVVDASIPEWLDGQLKASKAQADRICFQISGEIADKYRAPAQILARALRGRGLRFAIDQFGSGRDPESLLGSMPLDFVKIDGALIQGLAASEELQKKVKELVEVATRHKIQTIAERVEDANTMAVLWQLGVQFVQGYFVREPQEVVLRVEK